MNARVYTYQRDGRTNVAIIEESYIPLVEPTIFLDRYKSGISYNSKATAAYELLFFLNFLSAKQILIVDRIASGNMLSGPESRAFCQCAKLKSDSAFEEDEVLHRLSLTSKAIDFFIHAAKYSQATVVPLVTNNRIKTAIQYCEFLFAEYHKMHTASTEVKSAFREMIATLEFGKRRDAAARLVNKTYDPNNSVIPDEIFVQLLEMVQVNSPSNPFKHAKNRNRLIVLLLINTGMRIGGLAKLKISDCEFVQTGNRLYVKRTPDDPQDTRRFKPAHKSREHSVYLSPQLMEELSGYIKNKRSTYATALVHEFVFVTEVATAGNPGQPLSLAAIENIFKVLSTALNYHINPHMLRHKWNEIFSEAADDDSQFSYEEKENIRKNAMGWSPTSVMGQRYNMYKELRKQEVFQQNMQIKLLNIGVD